MAIQNQLMQLVLHCKYLHLGWSEKYHLPDLSFDLARTRGARIVSWRVASLAPPGEVCWARVSFVDTPRDTIAVPGTPAQALEYQGRQATPFEDPYTALHYRLETAEGRWANRLFRGIGDELVAELKLQGFQEGDPAMSPLTDAQTDAINLTDTAEFASKIFRGMLNILKRDTVYARLETPGPAFTWDVRPWANVYYRKIANRQTGRPFGMTRGRSAKNTAPPA